MQETRKSKMNSFLFHLFIVVMVNLRQCSHVTGTKSNQLLRRGLSGAFYQPSNSGMGVIRLGHSCSLFVFQSRTFSHFVFYSANFKLAMAVEVPISGRDDVAMSFCISAAYTVPTVDRKSGFDPPPFKTVNEMKNEKKLQK